MSIEPPSPGRPWRPHGRRNPGDAWVVAPSGQRYWGRFGAAGLLAVDADRGIVLQHRAGWSHFGDTWGLPGGARHEGESARDAALREAEEEAGIPVGAVRPRILSTFDLGIWSYTTVVGDVTSAFEPRVTDPESREVAWVPVAHVDGRDLHPGFAASWPRLRSLLTVRPAVVVDAANVVGSVPDGWWRDRVGATERLLGRVVTVASRGVPGAALGLPEDVWFPEWLVVVEGRARAACAPAEQGAPVPGVHEVDVVRAPGSGDDAIVAQTKRLIATRSTVTVVTSDRDLSARVAAIGAGVRGTRWFHGLAGPASLPNGPEVEWKPT